MKVSMTSLSGFSDFCLLYDYDSLEYYGWLFDSRLKVHSVLYFIVQ